MPCGATVSQWIKTARLICVQHTSRKNCAVRSFAASVALRFCCFARKAFQRFYLKVPHWQKRFTIVQYCGIVMISMFLYGRRRYTATQVCWPDWDSAEIQENLSHKPFASDSCMNLAFLLNCIPNCFRYRTITHLWRRFGSEVIAGSLARSPPGS